MQRFSSNKFSMLPLDLRRPLPKPIATLEEVFYTEIIKYLYFTYKNAGHCQQIFNRYNMVHTAF